MEDHLLSERLFHLETGSRLHLSHGVLTGVQLLAFLMELDLAAGIRDEDTKVHGGGSARGLTIAGVGHTELGPLDGSARNRIFLENGQLRGLVVAEHHRLFIAGVQRDGLHPVCILVRQIVGGGDGFLRDSVGSGVNTESKVSYLKNHAEEFAELLAQKTTKDYERESRNRQQHLQELMARNKEVDRLFERIYEDNVSGKLTDERFMKMSQRYDEEQQQLKKDIEELQRQCDKENDRAFCKEQFFKAVRKFMEMKTLTPTILHELVERIDVYQTQGRGKNRTQRIVIHYNFIGVLDLPEVEEYPENVVLDSRQGVAIEYLVGKAG